VIWLDNFGRLFLQLSFSSVASSTPGLLLDLLSR